MFPDNVKHDILRDIYLHYKDHRSTANWVFNEASWDYLSTSEQEFWESFVKFILKKVHIEKLLLKGDTLKRAE